MASALAGLLAVPGPAAARGRATQVKTWARYGSRVEATRSWMAGTFQGYVKSADFAALKTDTDPKKVGWWVVPDGLNGRRRADAAGASHLLSA